jgi:glucosamine 6-phosphate synthetase-like amidotransferase/phosphosugar isomerase protein
MCGIFCSKDLSTFEILEQANRERGNFATGIAWISKDFNYDITKRQGTVDLSKILPKDCTYLGHNQAPTSSVRKWQEHTTHPFEAGDWVVAHNGVLTNFKELAKNIPNFHGVVDSSIIPALLAENDYTVGPPSCIAEEAANIARTLELLQGTFAVWIINIRTFNVYVARQGSTLFYKGTNVSSIKGKRYREVNEGIIYRLTNRGLKPEEGFIAESPFLTL